MRYRIITTRHKILQSMVVFLNSKKEHYDVLSKRFRLDILKDVKPSFGDQFMVRDIELTKISNKDLIVFSMRSILYDLLNNTDHFASSMLEGSLQEQYDNFKELKLFKYCTIKNNDDQLKSATNQIIYHEAFYKFIREYGKSLLVKITQDQEKQRQLSVGPSL